MKRADIFSLRNSKVNTFLFASVGIDPNGTELTILSLLARLGKDPWSEAEAWAKLPAADTVDLLAAGIGHMALNQHSAHHARATASRLVELLPNQALMSDKIIGSTHERAANGKLESWWLPICAAAYAFLIAVALGLSVTFSHTVGANQQPVAQSDLERTPIHPTDFYQ